jgi:hypothetical protein
MHSAGMSPLDPKRGIDLAVSAAVAELARILQAVQGFAGIAPSLGISRWVRQ